MELVVFMGLQASGKSSFFVKQFFDTHVRISLDLLKTRHRERSMLDLCLSSGQRCVIDNTNPTVLHRKKYIVPAKAVGFKVIGYYFNSNLEECLERNSKRLSWLRVPEVALKSVLSKLERPQMSEGFDKLYHVSIKPSGLASKDFTIREWIDVCTETKPTTPKILARDLIDYLPDPHDEEGD